MAGRACWCWEAGYCGRRKLMKILLVITGLGVGGAERLVTALADRFSSQGHEVVLAYFHGGAELVPSDDHIRLLNLKMTRTPFGVISAAWRLRKLILEFRPDVVNTHLVHANILSRLLRLITPIPKLVTSAHNTFEGGHLRMLGYRLTNGLANASTNVSQEAVEAFERSGAVPTGSMVAVLNGIDTDRFSYDEIERDRVRRELGCCESTQLILAVGRLEPQKDYPNLLRAFANVVAVMGDARLVIVGKGRLRSELGSLSKSLGIDHCVAFLGVRHDVPSLMSASDVFVLSSAREGFGLVVAEAMACKRVVVATDCGGVSEVVGSSGYLVHPKDSKELGQALINAIHLPKAERARIGEKARERVESNFSLAAMADRYLEIYKKS